VSEGVTPQQSFEVEILVDISRQKKGAATRSTVVVRDLDAIHVGIDDIRKSSETLRDLCC
jgi:hypothetical protein